jgi:hypothetical protein
MLARACVGILMAMTIWSCLEWVAHAAPPERRCLPLIISGTRCGKMCRTPAGAFVIRGCKPLNKLIRT